MKNLFAIVLLLFIFITPSFAQKKSVVDSLERLFLKAQDTQRADILNKLCWEHRNYDFNKAIAYGNEALRLAEKYQNSKQLVLSNNYLGVVYRNIGNYTRAMQMFLASNKVAEESHNLEDLGYSFNNIGDILRIQKNYKEAKTKVIKARDIFISINDSVGLAYAYLRLGEIFQELKEYDEAQTVFFQCLNIRKRQSRIGALQSVYNRIGKTYLLQENYDGAIFYLHNSLRISDTINDQRSSVSSKIDIARVHLGLNATDSASYYAEMSMSQAQRIGSKQLIKDAALLISDIANIRGDYKKAYLYHAKFTDIYEEILGETSQKVIETMQFTYELEKKQAELDLLNKDKVIRRNVDIAIGVFALLIGIFILFLFRTIKERNRKNEELKEKNNEISMIAENLSLANHEVSEQKYVIDKKNKSIIDSLNYAKRIQTTILPSKTYIRQFLQDFFVFFRPRDIVSGDFYWFHQNISEGGSKIVIVIADCTGHGVPGAFMSLIGATLLNKIIKDNGEFNPAEILRKLDLAIQHDLRQKDTGNMDGMDAVICVIDVKEKNMLFSGAKNPIFYVQDDKPFFIKGSKEAVGGEQDEHHYTLHEIDLTKKTMFYLYSDGFQDQFSGKTGKKYMSKNFRDLLFRIHHLPLDKQLEALKSALFDWQEEEAQVDDILVFGAKIQL